MLKNRQSMLRACALVAVICVTGITMAQLYPAPMPAGPHDVKVLEGGVGIDKPLPADAAYLAGKRKAPAICGREHLKPEHRHAPAIAHGERIAPAYDDNHLNLVSRIRVDIATQLDGVRLRLRGWNAAGIEVPTGAR